MEGWSLIDKDQLKSSFYYVWKKFSWTTVIEGQSWKQAYICTRVVYCVYPTPEIHFQTFFIFPGCWVWRSTGSNSPRRPALMGGISSVKAIDWWWYSWIWRQHGNCNFSNSFLFAGRENFAPLRKFFWLVVVIVSLAGAIIFNRLRREMLQDFLILPTGFSWLSFSHLQSWSQWGLGASTWFWPSSSSSSLSPSLSTLFTKM